MYMYVINYWKIDRSKNHTHTLFMINNLFIQLTFTHNKSRNKTVKEKPWKNNQIIYTVQKTFIIIVVVVIIIILCLGFDGKDVGNGQHNITGSTA